MGVVDFGETEREREEWGSSRLLARSALRRCSTFFPTRVSAVGLGWVGPARRVSADSVRRNSNFCAGLGRAGGERGLECWG